MSPEEPEEDFIDIDWEAMSGSSSPVMWDMDEPNDSTSSDVNAFHPMAQLEMKHHSTPWEPMLEQAEIMDESNDPTSSVNACHPHMAQIEMKHLPTTWEPMLEQVEMNKIPTQHIPPLALVGMTEISTQQKSPMPKLAVRLRLKKLTPICSGTVSMAWNHYSLSWEPAVNPSFAQQAMMEKSS